MGGTPGWERAHTHGAKLPGLELPVRRPRAFMSVCCLFVLVQPVGDWGHVGQHDRDFALDPGARAQVEKEEALYDVYRTVSAEDETVWCGAVDEELPSDDIAHPEEWIHNGES